MRANGQGVIPSDWDGQFCKWAVCWPDSPQWLAVLRRVLVLPSEGRFWQEGTGNIRTAQSVIRETFDVNLHLKESIMSCGDESLNKIAAGIMALAAAQCCGEGIPAGGVIQVTIPVEGGGEIPLYGTVPPVILPPGEVPADYPGSYSEFKNDQCNTANEMVDNWATTMRNLGRINFAQTNGLIVVILFAVVGLITVSPVMIPALIGYAIISVLTQNMWFAFADGIEANRDAIVCAILQHGSVVEAFAAIEEIVNTIVISLGISTLQGAALKAVALLLMNTDTLNKLYQLTQAPYPESDCNCDVCSACINRLSQDLTIIATLDAPVEEWLQLSSHFSVGVWNVVLEVNTGDWLIEWQNIQNWTDPGIPQPNFSIGQNSEGNVFTTDNFLAFAAASEVVCIHTPDVSPVPQWNLKSSTAFTVEIKITACT